MKDNNVLFQIRTLEKIIIRHFSTDLDLVIEANHKGCIPVITPTQIQIMEYIINHNREAIYQKDLEEILNLRRATVSGVLQTMEKNGLLERVADPADARVKRIILNNKARELFLQNEKNLKEFERLITNNIKSENLEIFSYFIKKIIDNIKLIETNKIKKKKGE